MTRLLFAGDSVTDCGRTFFAPDVAAGELGAGWVRVVAGVLDRDLNLDRRSALMSY